MNIGKKGVLGLAAILASTLIAGCGNSPTNTSQPANNKSLVYFIFTGYAAPYFAPMAQAVQQAAKYYPNLTIKIVDANGSASQEITDIKEAVANNAKGIILNPVNGSVTAAAQQAMKQGVPVVAIDRDVNSTTARDVFIGDNDKELGYLQTHYALQYLTNHNIPTPWHVAILQGTLGSSTAIDRLAGAMKALQPYITNGKVKIVLNQSANFETSTAQTIMSEFLAKDSNVQLVIASNDAMALGALTALKNAGIQAGKTTYVVGADAQPQSLTAVANGTQLDTVTHSPFVEAYWAVEAMDNILQYHTLPPKNFDHGDVIIPMTLVTKANVSKIAGWGTPQTVPPLPYGHATSHAVASS
ncbi:sugar ABC transporter substrate-binding protein [Sulfobacillus thermosulfidooxidans]|uniref:sugar ABC transporter substrate-binding protein n=1 Tax=Sulfobacillus thermosulfidooxidans TaxID=28034 RepID=UPI00030DE2FF|nr:sugar ABC transporter substrate-binding protein [Sulfobacillus thermosulfidooxidans]